MEDNRPLRHHHHACDCSRCILRDIRHYVRLILYHLNPIRSVEITIMPKTIAVGATANAVIAAFDQLGKPFPLTPTDVIALAASVPTDVSFGTPSVNPDGTATIVVTGVAPDAGDSITATVSGVTSSADVLTVTAPVPVLTTMTLTLE